MRLSSDDDGLSNNHAMPCLLIHINKLHGKRGQSLTFIDAFPTVSPIGQELREEIMLEIATVRASDHGMTCPKCERSLPVAEWVERMDDGKIHYLWWCNCGNKFMTALNCPIVPHRK